MVLSRHAARSALSLPAFVVALLLAAPAFAQPAPRILGSSVSIEPKKFGARVLIANDPGGRVTRVVFNLTPRCPGDPSTPKYAAVPDVVATDATQEGEHRAFSASLPDPSDGAFGAWTVRSTAFDASGGIVGRHQTFVTRAFEPRFRTLAFEVPQKGVGAPTLDTSGAAATAHLVVDLDHDAPITSFGVITSTHDNPAFGYAKLPGELETDRAEGIAPWLTSRIEQKAPTTLIGHFGFPANTPQMSLSIKKMFMTDARCRTAELAPRSPLALAVTSKAPRALPYDVRLDKSALANGQLVVAFRLFGPAPRTAPAPELAGQRAPVVTVNLLDTSSPPQVLGSTAARPVAVGRSEMLWDAESMAIAPITIPTPSALGEALKKGLQVEIDDGGTPLAPRAVLKR